MHKKLLQPLKTLSSADLVAKKAELEMGLFKLKITRLSDSSFDASQFKKIKAQIAFINFQLSQNEELSHA
jgi:ribosomal protein L29